MQNNISVIIPTYNLKKDLIEAIESLLSQSLKSFEIIVVDNASTDGTAEAMRDFIKAKKIDNVILIQNKKNLGVTGGRNSGIKNAKGKYLLFFDHDMVADKHMLQELLKVAESKKEIGIVTPKIYYWEEKNNIWSAGTDVNVWTGQSLFRGGDDIGQYQKVQKVSVAPAVLLVKEEVIKKIGGFDNIYFATYEDTDYCFRAKKSGYLTYYTPYAIAYHKIPFSVDLSLQRLIQRTYWVSRNRIIFMKKFGKSFIVFLFFLPLFSLYYLALSFKYRKPKAALNYVRGIIDGLKYKNDTTLFR